MQRCFQVIALLYPFYDPKIADSAITKCVQGFRVCGTIIRGSRLLQTRIFDNDSALLNPLFAGNRCVAPSEETRPKRCDGRERELGRATGIPCRVAASKKASAEASHCWGRETGIGGELFGIRNNRVIGSVTA